MFRIVTLLRNGHGFQGIFSTNASKKHSKLSFSPTHFLVIEEVEWWHEEDNGNDDDDYYIIILLRRRWGKKTLCRVVLMTSRPSFHPGRISLNCGAQKVDFRLECAFIQLWTLLTGLLIEKCSRLKCQSIASFILRPTDKLRRKQKRRKFFHVQTPGKMSFLSSASFLSGETRRPWMTTRGRGYNVRVDTKYRLIAFYN